MCVCVWLRLHLLNLLARSPIGQNGLEGAKFKRNFVTLKIIIIIDHSLTAIARSAPCCLLGPLCQPIAHLSRLVRSSAECERANFNAKTPAASLGSATHALARAP